MQFPGEQLWRRARKSQHWDKSFRGFTVIIRFFTCRKVSAGQIISFKNFWARNILLTQQLTNSSVWRTIFANFDTYNSSKATELQSFGDSERESESHSVQNVFKKCQRGDAERISAPAECLVSARPHVANSCSNPSNNSISALFWRTLCYCNFLMTTPWRAVAEHGGV